MKNTELYEKTVNLLLDAYNDNKLEHGDCSACAVGNICQTGLWGYDFYTESTEGKQMKRPSLDAVSEEIKEFLVINTVPSYKYGLTKAEKKRIREALDKAYANSGYTKEELMKIEFAFESSINKTKEGYDFWTEYENTKQGQFIGLCAVLDVLKEIHQTEESVHTESVKNLTEIKDKKLALA